MEEIVIDLTSSQNTFYQKAIAVDFGEPISLKDAAQRMANQFVQLSKASLYEEAIDFLDDKKWPEILSQQGFRIEFSADDFILFEDKMSA
jgi:hypothetical protein